MQLLLPPCLLVSSSLVDSRPPYLALQDIMYLVSLVVENLCLSLDDNQEMVFCLKVRRRGAARCCTGLFGTPYDGRRASCLPAFLLECNWVDAWLLVAFGAGGCLWCGSH